MIRSKVASEASVSASGIVSPTVCSSSEGAPGAGASMLEAYLWFFSRLPTFIFEKLDCKT